MGVDLAVMVVRGARLAELAPLGHRPLGVPVPGSEAASARVGLSGLEHAGDVVLLDAGFAWLDVGERVVGALARPVATALFGGASDTWLFQLDLPGRATRRVAWHRGALADAVGTRLPEERDEPLDEARLGRLLARVTGFPGTLDWLGASWQPLDAPPPAS